MVVLTVEVEVLEGAEEGDGIEVVVGAEAGVEIRRVEEAVWIGIGIEAGMGIEIMVIRMYISVEAEVRVGVKKVGMNAVGVIKTKTKSAVIATAR